MKHPRVPNIIIGQKSNGFVKGDIMDANAVSQYITEKLARADKSQNHYEELHDEIHSLLEKNDKLSSLVRDIIDDVNNFGTIGDHLLDLQTIETQLLIIQQTVDNYIKTEPTVSLNIDGDLVVSF